VAKQPEAEPSPILILIKGSYAELLRHTSCKILQFIKSRTLVSEIEIDDTPEFKNFRGTVVRVFDADQCRKVQAAKLLFEDYFDEVSKFKLEADRYELFILISESKCRSRSSHARKGQVG
jgi:hypothetical protein